MSPRTGHCRPILPATGADGAVERGAWAGVCAGGRGRRRRHGPGTRHRHPHGRGAGGIGVRPRVDGVVGQDDPLSAGDRRARPEIVQVDQALDRGLEPPPDARDGVARLDHIGDRPARHRRTRRARRVVAGRAVVRLGQGRARIVVAGLRGPGRRGRRAAVQRTGHRRGRQAAAVDALDRRPCGRRRLIGNHGARIGLTRLTRIDRRIRGRRHIGHGVRRVGARRIAGLGRIAGAGRDRQGRARDHQTPGPAAHSAHRALLKILPEIRVRIPIQMCPAVHHKPSRETRRKWGAKVNGGAEPPEHPQRPDD